MSEERAEILKEAIDAISLLKLIDSVDSNIEIRGKSGVILTRPAIWLGEAVRAVRGLAEKKDVECEIDDLIERLREVLLEVGPSREVSLALTKLDECRLWVQEAGYGPR